MSRANDLSDFYSHVQQSGKLRTPAHAQRWSNAVLKTLGLNLDRRTKRKMADALPEELADALNRVFWLIHFRNTGLTGDEFLNQVSRRSGNTDADFARYPTVAVFGGLKRMIGPDLADRVAQSLSPEVSQLWNQA